MLLKKGMILPSLRLREISGGELALDSSRGRRNLVLFLLHPAGCNSCEAKLQELAEGYPELVAEGADVLAVFSAVPPTEAVSRASSRFPFPLLVDAERSLGDGATIIITDRFGEIFHLVHAGEGHQLLSVAEIADWLAFIGVQCPE